MDKRHRKMMEENQAPPPDIQETEDKENHAVFDASILEKKKAIDNFNADIRPVIIEAVRSGYADDRICSAQAFERKIRNALEGLKSIYVKEYNVRVKASSWPMDFEMYVQTAAQTGSKYLYFNLCLSAEGHITDYDVE